MTIGPDIDGGFAQGRRARGWPSALRDHLTVAKSHMLD
jgi:hypothetical protein